VGINRATATGPGVGEAHATSPKTAKQVQALYMFNPLGDEVDAFEHEERQCNVFLQTSLHCMARHFLGPLIAQFWVDGGGWVFVRGSIGKDKFPHWDDLRSVN
jgi:hypothetical protein